MAMTTPILQDLLIVDAEKDFSIEFNVIGGNQVYSNEVIIEDNSTGLQVYNKKIDSFLYMHTVTKNILTNGKTYRVKIKTYDVTGQYSNFSNYSIIKCYSTPIVSLINVSNIINAQDYIVKASYSQAQNINYQSYKFILYDEHKSILYIQDEKNDTDMQCQITGLENNKQYYIQCIFKYANSKEVATDLIQFTAQYIQAKIQQVMKTTNDRENAKILIEARMIQILGQIGKQPVTFENDEWVNVKDGMVYYDTEHGFELSGNWTLQIWCKDITVDKDFLVIYGNNAITIKFQLYNNKIHLFKFLNNNLISHYASNEININSSEDSIYIYCTCDNHRHTLKAEILK